MSRWIAFGMWSVAACTAGGPGTDVSDTDLPCAPYEGDRLEISQDLASGPMKDGGDIRYGTPPQGGAPFSPFELRIQALWPDPSARVAARGLAVDAATGEEIGSVQQSQAFFCSNTGVHEGWLYGGELHIRYWGMELEALAGRELDITVEVDIAEGETVTASGSGRLVWDL